MATELRSDAAANRARLIEAARAAFAEHGPDVTVDEIARLAGVGVGTLYRRFPKKEQLVRAILEERVSDLLLLLRSIEGDSVATLTSFLDAMVRIQADDRGVVRLMAQTLGDAAYPDNVSDLYDAVWALIRSGQRAGQIRDDVKENDVPSLLRMANATVGNSGSPREELKAALRCASIVVDGLRSS
jgi:AcrR family transcriptional regulator